MTIAQMAEIIHSWTLACPAACEGAAREISGKINQTLIHYENLAEATEGKL